MKPQEAKFYAYEEHCRHKTIWGFGDTEAEALRSARPHVHTMIELHVAPMTDALRTVMEYLLFEGEPFLPGFLETE